MNQKKKHVQNPSKMQVSPSMAAAAVEEAEIEEIPQFRRRRWTPWALLRRMRRQR
jgi:hypothetical protein